MTMAAATAASATGSYLPLPLAPASSGARPAPPPKRDFAVGTSIPANLPHAVSVSLPLWQDNVDYEEGRLSQIMETGYPRFFIHRSIQKLATHLTRKFAKPHEKCILLPSEAVANRCRDFIRRHHAKLQSSSSSRRSLSEQGQQQQQPSQLSVRIVRFSILDPSISTTDPIAQQYVASTSRARDPATHYIFIVFFPAEVFPLAKSYWQHTGDGITSRQAERCLHLLEQSGSLDDEAAAAGSASSDASATTAAGADASFVQHQQQQQQQHDATQDASAVLTPAAEGGKAGISGKRFYNRYARNGSVPNASIPSPSSSGILPPKSSEAGQSAAGPEVASKSRAAAEEDKLTSDLSAYVEERYGRNLPKGSAPQAKLALRRRIAGTLLSDRSGQPSSADAPSASGGNGGIIGETSRTGTGVTEDEVYLYPTGMSSIFHAHQLAMLARSLDDPAAPVGKSVCFGFPYTDTLKILQKWGPGCHFYGNGLDSDLDDLERLVEASSNEGTPILALFCEFPSNPLLRSPDLARIRSLADRYHFVVVVDETIGNFVNVEVLPFADMLVSSLTKVFSGDANVMGGSLVLNPRSSHFDRLKRAQAQHYEDMFFDEDALFLERNSRDFVGRIVQIDENTRTLTEMLAARKAAGRDGRKPAIKDIFYPRFTSRENYEKCRRKIAFLLGAEMGVNRSSSIPTEGSGATDAANEGSSHNDGSGGAGGGGGGGYGGLFSLTFHSLAASRAFYDSLQCAKGPSLGTNYTLASPYTILAHYTELDWAAQFGVETGLVRISVGLEEREELLRMFERSVEMAERAMEAA